MTISYDPNKTLVIATHNPAKLDCFKCLLANEPFRVISLRELQVKDEVEEAGITYEQNAIIKATFFAKLTGYKCISDDSGIEVPALNNRPGIDTKYYGGNISPTEKRRKLLQEMANVEKEDRDVYVHSAVAFATPEGKVVCKKSIVSGYVSLEDRGGIHQGQLFNSVILIPEQNKTMAELFDEGYKVEFDPRTYALQEMVKELCI